MTTILHLSDIHRTPDRDGEVTNAVLVDSLMRDLERQSISMPDAIDIIVISGDLVQGVSVDAEDGSERLDAQYREAEAFLVELAERLVRGERERIVLVPGNHDINWQTSSASMKVFPATAKKYKELVTQLTGRSRFRWSWKTLDFFHIDKPELYAQRNSNYSEFVGKFYQGARGFSLKEEEQYSLYIYESMKISIVALNSCWHNDHLQQVGQIHAECIARAAQEIRARGISDYFLIAVWHHNVRGLPLDTGYLDYRCLEHLLDIGVRLGLHGHQHLNEVLSEQSRLLRGRRMLLVSAGSLCAGPKEIPSGERRSYNVIRISDQRDELRVDTRVSVSTDALVPIWTSADPAQVTTPIPAAAAGDGQLR